MKRFILVTTLFVITTLTCFATTVERLSLDDLVKKAHVIVHGRVRDARSHWSSNGRLILTTYTVDVAETIKGQPGRVVDVTTVGGRVGDVILNVAGMPSFQRGEDAVIFLETSAGLSTVVGLSQGKYLVQNGEVSNVTSGLTFPDGRNGAPLKMRLEDFKRQIENRLR
jgi:hypothetical protein